MTEVSEGSVELDWVLQHELQPCRQVFATRNASLSHSPGIEPEMIAVFSTNEVCWFLVVGIKNTMEVAVDFSAKIAIWSSGQNVVREGKVSGDNSWTNSDTSSSGDVFSGWVDTNSPHSKPENPAGGIVAGVILAAGLTFTSLYLSKRNTSAQKPGMEALSAQQEMLLSSDDQNEDEQVKTTDSTARPDEDFLGNDSSPESMSGIIMDSSSSQEITDATFERRPVDDINAGPQ
ncbi:hypothetical protein IFM89_037694 [Coptis chinensis]|uniref:Uncharacterized protein n=1 Tax=Coptis chinensis TaxID=261450 RepID=A0A835IH34_9MAGN|nr:hypothetical protein IFM89_037694 [Coptis chinensis]